MSKSARESLSQFAARVLEQLRLSAWLPAGLLVALLYVMAQVRLVGAELVGVYAAVLNTDWETLLTLALSTAVVATGTQAFSFGSIRVLEGYWGPGHVGSAAARIGYRIQHWRRDRIIGRHDELESRAFAKARQSIATDIGAAEAAVLEAQRNSDELTGFSKAAVEKAERLDWQEHSSPQLLRRLDAYEDVYRHFPAESRMLPTTLGNTLRAAEDRAFPDESNLETAVLKIYDKASPSLQVQHDDHRNELDLYATNVFVFLLAALASPLLMWGLWRAVGIFVLASMLAMWINYRALRSSARAYGAILQTLADQASSSESAKREQPGSWRPAQPLN